MNEAIRSRIEERLRAKKMTQRDLAENLNVTEVTVSRWLNGERDPSIETLNKIAKALDTSASYFFIDNSRQNEDKMPEEKSGSVNWGAILAGTALTATAVIGIVALAKAMGKLNEKDTEQIEDILNRK
ncbi:helix-turn-helix transcriptional regulator [uncultured Treponema sp.]|uniref:helix-turn-helix transcriptional regulator n=1 Tax=uncultured Treponema sp. TaxID=162155 RepID=UPI0025F1F87D|nr:helix-turn-helix transcriptional regulator [uncultured Treponema sp.]